MFSLEAISKITDIDVDIKFGILCLTCTNLTVMASDILNDTSRYLDNKFTIDNPEF